MENQSKGNSRLALLGAAHSFNHSLFLIAPALLSVFIEKDLGTSPAETGLVTGIASFIYGAGALVGGPLGERIGEAKTIIMCLTMSGLSAFIMLATGFAHTIYIYALAMILMAAWASLYHPTANSLISKTFKGRVSEAMGLHGVGGTLGVVITPLAAGILGRLLGWQWAFAAFGSICIILALAFMRKFGKTERKREKHGTLIDALRIPELRVLLLFNVTIGLFMKGVELYFQTYLMKKWLIDPWWAWLAYTLVLAAGVLGQWIGGKTADKIGSRRVLIATSTGVSLSLLSLLFMPIYMVGIGIFIILYGLSFYAHQPALNSLTGFLSPQNQRGAVYGVFFFTSFGIGAISQIIAGYMIKPYGLDSAFYMFTAFALVALLLSFKLPEKRESD